MEAICHFKLSQFILNKPGIKIKIRHKLAFLIGSIAPDIMPVTHVKGHTYKGRFKEVRSTVKKIMGSGKMGIWSSFRLGMAIHYLADFFTFPHNPEFQGTMSEHCNYEEKMRILFTSYLDTLPTDGSFGDTSDVAARDIGRMIKQNHRDFLQNRLSKYDDCAYIIATCGMVTQAVVQYLQPSPLEQILTASAANLGSTVSLTQLYFDSAYPLPKAGG